MGWQVTKRVCKYVVFPVCLWILAATGLLVQRDVWASAIWLFVVAVLLAPLVYDLVHVAAGDVKRVNLDLWWNHPSKEFNRHFNKETAASVQTEMTRRVHQTAKRRRYFWVIPLVLFASFLLLIFSHVADSVWVLVAGNANFGQPGFGLFSILLVALSHFMAMVLFYGVLKAAYKPKFPLGKTIVYVALTPLAFVLPIGLSIITNSGF